MILLIDNYDSFVHNLARYLEELGAVPHVVRNDAITVDGIRGLKPEAIILSPGPCRPEDAGITLEVIRTLAGQIPMLGVCLGHQSIGQAFGATVRRAQEPMHGRTSLVQHTGQGLFEGIPQPLQAMRYHSLVVDKVQSPLRVTARTDDGTVMAIEHEASPVWGVQFHPESVLTQCGHQLLANFLRLAGISSRGYQSTEYQPPRVDPDDFFRREIEDDAAPRL